MKWRIEGETLTDGFIEVFGKKASLTEIRDRLNAATAKCEGRPTRAHFVIHNAAATPEAPWHVRHFERGPIAWFKLETTANIVCDFLNATP